MIQIELLLAGFTDSSGNPLAAGKVYTYEAGTTTDKNTYQDADGNTAHANPIILDSQGRKLAYGDGLYKFVIKDSDDNTLYTFDDVTIGPEYTKGVYYLGTASFSTNAYSGTLNPEIQSYTTGMRVVFIAGAANTSAATLNLNSIGATEIRNISRAALVADDILANAVVEVIYDGTYFIIVTPNSNYNNIITRAKILTYAGGTYSDGIFSTASASSVNVTTTEITITVLTGEKLDVTVDGLYSHSLANGDVILVIAEDTTGKTFEYPYKAYRAGTTGLDSSFSIRAQFTGTAGSRTIRLRARTSSGTAYLSIRGFVIIRHPA